MASEKRIFTLTLIVLLVVFLSFNTVLPCWVLGQCAQREEGFQEGATPKDDLYQETSIGTKKQINELLEKMKSDTTCNKGKGKNPALDKNNCKTLKEHPIGPKAKDSPKLPGAYVQVMNGN